MSEKQGLPDTENKDTDNTDTENPETINNRLTNNRLTNNNVEYQQIAALYNSICVSFPRLTKLSDKRRASIRARFKQGYTSDDFKKVFELAEGSRFLKGGNNRNWHATFDWMVADANMAKILDGNYTDREGGEKDATTADKSGRSARGFYEQFMGTSDSE